MIRALEAWSDRLVGMIVPKIKAQAACIDGHYQCCNTTCTVERYVCFNTVTDTWYYGPCVHT